MQLNVKYRKVEDLIPYVNNSRKHSDEQVAQISASIKEFGWTNPILIDGTNSIIAGHGRLMAARKLKMDEVPTIELDHLTDTQRKALVIADNKLALNADWDNTLLTIELDELLKDGFALDILGFDSIELAKLFDVVEPDDIKEQSYNEVFNIIVECKDEQEQEKIFNRLDSEGYKCRVQSL
jgi:ParB-like chromosome segregation protein Spo0J